MCLKLYDDNGYKSTTNLTSYYKTVSQNWETVYVETKVPKGIKVIRPSFKISMTSGKINIDYLEVSNQEKLI